MVKTNTNANAIRSAREAGTSAGFTLGIDLGQSKDASALAMIETITPPLVRGEKSPQKVHWLGNLERWPLGTRYPDVVADVKGRYEAPQLAGRATLVVDRTGVGIAVTDMFVEAGLRPVAITITGGNEVLRDGPYHIKVPKQELVGTLVALYQGHRLKVSPRLVLGPVLIKELGNFKVKVSLTTGNESYEGYRDGDHDDLVLAVALACWYAENRPSPPPMPTFVAGPSRYRAGTPQGWPSTGRPPGYR